MSIIKISKQTPKAAKAPKEKAAAKAAKKAAAKKAKKTKQKKTKQLGPHSGGFW